MEKKRAGLSLYIKQAAVSVCCYGVIFALLFYPWIVIGDASYHPLGFAMNVKDSGLEPLIAAADIYVDAEDFSSLDRARLLRGIFPDGHPLCFVGIDREKAPV